MGYLMRTTTFVHAFDPTGHEVHTAEPESLNVGKLNEIVRALREELYQKQLRIQELQDRCKALAKELDAMEEK